MRNKFGLYYKTGYFCIRIQERTAHQQHVEQRKFKAGDEVSKAKQQSNRFETTSKKLSSNISSEKFGSEEKRFTFAPAIEKRANNNTSSLKHLHINK